MKTPANAASELLKELTKMGFTPGRWDTPDTRQLQTVTKDGHPDLRVIIDHDGEPTPHSLRLIKFDGKISQINTWEATLSAHMPLKAFLALIKASI
jgi:hypothetical protein